MKFVAMIKQHIDKTTMYRTVLYSLLGLVFWSWVLGFVGLVAFFPVAMAVQLLIIIGVGFGVDRLLAYAFKVRPNPESILITGLIVYFLISPNGTTESFVLGAIASALAAASKYLVVWRGKHVFNPAAFGVAITGLLGIGFASWWVATPWLLPFVLLPGLVVVYKTRRLEMVGVYTASSLLVIGATAMLRGEFNVGVLWTAIASYPVIFLACFMLTEPQTLAQKRQQRNVIAVIVAVLSFALGSLFVTPEIALLVGNLIAAIIAGRRSGVLQLTGRRQLPGNQVEYAFFSQTPLVFEAGQYVELHLPHIKPDVRGVRRMFTLSSRPGGNEVTLITRHPHPSSSFKKTLMKLPIGRNVRVTGVWGDFILPKNSKQKILMIAGGVGITPFLSQLDWFKHTGQVRDITLIYAVKDRQEAIDVAEYASHVHVIVHEGTLHANDIKNYSHDIRQRAVFVSGPPIMVDTTVHNVRRLGALSVHRDFFAGY